MEVEKDKEMERERNGEGGRKKGAHRDGVNTGRQRKEKCGDRQTHTHTRGYRPCEDRDQPRDRLPASHQMLGQRHGTHSCSQLSEGIKLGVISTR